MKLKPNQNQLRAAALTFLCGLTVNWALKPAAPDGAPAPPSAMKQPPPFTPAAPCPPAEPEGAHGRADRGQSPKGEEWKHLMNGVSLGLDYEALSEQEVAEARVTPLASGRVLAAAGDTLSMFDAAGRKVWEHRESQPIFDFAHVAATGLVYVAAGDNNLSILEARTGRERHRETRNGRGGFGQTVAYGRDLCLVTDDNSGYRHSEDPFTPMGDGVTAWRGTKMVWYRELPPDSELRVSGQRIFAVTKTGSRVLVKEITPPPDAR
jgi:hypothetical protein